MTAVPARPAPAPASIVGSAPVSVAAASVARGPSRRAPAAPMPALRARVRKRSISIAGHATSVSLEDPFWEALREIAAARGCSVADLVRRVDAARAAGVEEGEDGDGGPPANLSSALRVFVLDMVRAGQGTTGED